MKMILSNLEKRCGSLSHVMCIIQKCRDNCSEPLVIGFGLVRLAYKGWTWSIYLKVLLINNCSSIYINMDIISCESIQFFIIEEDISF